MADKGRYPLGSGTRTSRQGPPGLPSPPSPLSPCAGRGGETDPGEGQALPRTPGLPLRDRFPMNPCPYQIAMGEGAGG